VVFQYLGADDQDLIPRDSAPLLIYGNQSIAVAIQGQPNGRPSFQHELLKMFRMLRTAVVIDVNAVGGVVDHLKRGSKFGEYGWGHLICGTIRCVHDNPHAFHRQLAGEGVFQKSDVPAFDIINAVRPAHLLGWGHHFRELTS